VTSVVAEEYERRLRDELNSLLVDAVPDGASEAQAEDAILLAVMGHDAEIHALYEQMRKLARDKAGYRVLADPGVVGVNRLGDQLMI
jgi:hypothetical protein